MGIARIIAEYGGGEYAVQRIYDEDKLQSLRGRYQSLIDSLTEQIDKLEVEAADLKESSDAKTAEYLAAVDDYATLLRAAIEGGTDRPDKSIYLEKANSMIEAQGEYQKVKSQIGPLKLSRMSAQKQMTQIESAGDPAIEFAWCADYSEGLTGEVATIEIPGEPQQVVIRPQALGSPTYDPARDGQLMPREWMRADQVYLAAALLPGWQRHVYPYTAGDVSPELVDQVIGTGKPQSLWLVDGSWRAIDSLPAVRHLAKPSTAQNLPTNEYGAGPIRDVQVDYMSIDQGAFLPYDQVIVDRSTPSVIGFLSQPRERILAGPLSWEGDAITGLLSWGGQDQSGHRYFGDHPSGAELYYRGEVIANAPAGEVILGAGVIPESVGAETDDRLMVCATVAAADEYSVTAINVWAMPWVERGDDKTFSTKIGAITLPTPLSCRHVAAFSPTADRMATIAVPLYDRGGGLDDDRILSDMVIVRADVGRESVSTAIDNPVSASGTKSGNTKGFNWLPDQESRGEVPTDSTRNDSYTVMIDYAIDFGVDGAEQVATADYAETGSSSITADWHDLYGPGWDGDCGTAVWDAYDPIDTLFSAGCPERLWHKLCTHRAESRSTDVTIHVAIGSWGTERALSQSSSRTYKTPTPIAPYISDPLAMQDMANYLDWATYGTYDKRFPLRKTLDWLNEVWAPTAQSFVDGSTGTFEHSRTDTSVATPIGGFDLRNGYIEWAKYDEPYSETGTESPSEPFNGFIDSLDLNDSGDTCGVEARVDYVSVQESNAYSEEYRARMPGAGKVNLESVDYGSWTNTGAFDARSVIWPDYPSDQFTEFDRPISGVTTDELSFRAGDVLYWAYTGLFGDNLVGSALSLTRGAPYLIYDDNFYTGSAGPIDVEPGSTLHPVY